MKVAILSDTHGLLRPQVLDHLNGVDAILHAGDINNQAIVATLAQIAPLSIVRGNNDKDLSGLPHDLTVTLGGVTIYLVHNKKDVPRDLTGVDVVVYGHSHKYACQTISGVLWLNPGSCGKRRFDQAITMALLEVEHGRCAVEQIVIPHETA